MSTLDLVNFSFGTLASQPIEGRYGRALLPVSRWMVAVDCCEDELVLFNALAELERAALWAAGFAARAGCSAEITSRLQIILDEAVTNVFNHALCDAAPVTRTVVLRLTRRADSVELAICDDGPAFDPVSAPARSRGAERQPGGAGLVFLRHLVHEMRFFRSDGSNHLILTLKMPAKHPGSEEDIA